MLPHQTHVGAGTSSKVIEEFALKDEYCRLQSSMKTSSVVYNAKVTSNSKNTCKAEKKVTYVEVVKHMTNLSVPIVEIRF